MQLRSSLASIQRGRSLTFPVGALALAVALVALQGCGGGTAPAAPAGSAPASQPAAQPATQPAEPGKPAAQEPAKPAAPAPAKPTTAAPPAATKADQAAAKPAAGAGVTDAIVAAAKKEGEVNYYTANATLNANKTKAEAEKALGIKVNVIRLSSSLLYNRAVKEFDTGVFAADVFENSVIEHFLDMKKKGMLASFTPGSINLYKSKDYYDPDHTWHSASVALGAINYNSDLVKGDMIPKTWKELTDPKYKDKLAQGHVKASGTTAIITYHLVKLYGWEYFEGLRKNNILTQQSCDTTNLMASGERVVTLCDLQISPPAQAQGLPIATALPTDGVFGYLRPVAVMAKAPHPNAAKLFANWLLSPANQTLYTTLGGLMSPLDSPEVKYPADFPDTNQLKVYLTDPVEFGKWFPEGREKFADLFGG